MRKEEEGVSSYNQLHKPSLAGRLGPWEKEKQTIYAKLWHTIKHLIKINFAMMKINFLNCQLVPNCKKKLNNALGVLNTSI